MLKRKNIIYLKPFAAVCMLMLSACSSDEALPVPDIPDKTPIELTVGVIGEPPAATRSVVTIDNPYGQSATAFSSGTSLYMVMKSENSAGGSSPAMYTRTIGYAQENADAANNVVKFASAYGRFWEDSYSRNSQLSVYAACVPGYYLPASAYEGITPSGTADSTTPWTVGGSETYDNTWSSGASSTTIVWPLRGTAVRTQNATFIDNQDLCFSNNVSATPGDGRVTFNESSKKFGSGRLVFYHALTKVTFRIKKGEGFLTGDPFAFSNANENIVLKGFNTSGTFDITTGEFLISPAIGTGDITSLYNSGASGDYVYVLSCLMLPGTDLNNTDAEKIYFTIDGNLYHLTKKQLMDALSGKKLSDAIGENPGTDALTADHKMRPGVHYIFDMTVGKKKMDNFTASIVPWEIVNAEEVTPTNARITVSLLDNGEKVTENPANFDLYRLANISETINDSYESYTWTTGYAPSSTPDANKAYLNPGSIVNEHMVYTAYEASDHSNAWYWPDNKTFYHFRTVMPTGHTVTEDGTNGDNLTLTRAASYTDVCWGAPFKSTEGKLTYDKDTYGFDGSASHQISKAIGPTTGTINMEMFHMMSDVTINLTTTSGGDKVTLAGATIKLTNTYPTGKVLMGNGLVIPTGTVDDVTETVNESYKVENYGFVPQDLTSVVLTITTTDNNQYIVEMKDVVSSTVGNNLISNPYELSNGKYKINRWYPNYKYTYTFKLTKTGIAKITSTLANWETVVADSEDVQIK